MLKAIGILIGAWAITGAASAQTAQPNLPKESVIGGPRPTIVGLSMCENLAGAEKERCLMEEQARAGNGSAAAGGTGIGPGTTGAQNNPSGSTRRYRRSSGIIDLPVNP